jgi:SAM-dependent methyltransferase
MAPRGLRAIPREATARLILADILRMAEADGILACLARHVPVSFGDLCGCLAKELGYMPAVGNRSRMLAALLALLEHGGLAREAAGVWRWERRSGPPAAAARGDDLAAADAQYRFFRCCVESAPAYLRGGRPAVLFDESSASLWEQFLGCREFCAGRSLLLDLMGIPDDGRIALLDLCHGPGWGVDAVLRRLPKVRVTAIDFTEAFLGVAQQRADHARNESGSAALPAAPVAWVGPEAWKGFGDRLPFPDAAFHAVFFSCGDPYIPRRLRKEVYAEIARVLVPGGKLGVLTRSRPEARDGRVPSWPAVLALAHDFAESVCDGWEGFTPAGETADTFAAAGFAGAVPPKDRMSVLDGALWVLRKAGR